MSSVLEENPTRQKILLFLRKSGGLSTDELSNSLQITPMGVRQHLMALERKGLIRYDTIRHGIGRPNFIYRLTEKADEYFPKEYDNFALDLLREVEEKEGRVKLDQLFFWKKEKLLEKRKRQLSGDSLAEKVRSFSALLQNEGYIIDSRDSEDSYTLRQFNCPILAVSRAFPEACKYELELYRDLFGRGVERTQCLADSGLACEYLIPKV